MGVLNGHEYVEIGGVKWATMNIGATTSAQTGLYFQWGDTCGYTSGQCGSNSTSYKKPFSWGDYKFGNGTNPSSSQITAMTKYNSSDGLTYLEDCDDAARLNWGCGWKVPSSADYRNLYKNTTSAATSVGNVSGVTFTDKTNSSRKVFFPMAGLCSDATFSNVNGHYWGSNKTISSSSAMRFSFNDIEVLPYMTFQCHYGISIRPVVDE